MPPPQRSRFLDLLKALPETAGSDASVQTSPPVAKSWADRMADLPDAPPQGRGLSLNVARAGVEALKRIKPEAEAEAEQNIARLSPDDQDIAYERMGQLQSRKAAVMAGAAEAAEENRGSKVADRAIAELDRIDPDWRDPAKPIKATLGVLGDALSYVNNKKKQATMPGQSWTKGLPEVLGGESTDKAPTGDEWNAAIRKSEHPVLRAQTWAMDRAAAPIGGVIAGAMMAGETGARAIANLAVPGIVEMRVPTKENVIQTMKETTRSVADTVRDMGTDPVNWYGGGVGGTEAALATTSRVAKAAKLGAAETEALMGAVERIGATTMGTPDAWPEVKAAFASAFGDAAKGEAAAAKAWGEGGEFFHRAQMGINPPIPGLDKARVDLAALGLPEHGGKKLLQAAYEPIRRKILSPIAAGQDWAEPRKLFDATPEQADSWGRIGRGARAIDEAEFDKEASDLAEIAGRAGLNDEKRIEQMAEHFLDSGYTRETFDAGQPAIAAGRANADRAAEVMGAVGSPSKHRPAAAVEAIRAKALDRVAELPDAPKVREGVKITPWELPPDVAPPTAAEQEFIDAFRNLVNRRYEKLVAAGVLEEGQQAKNLVTGIYFPRIFKRRGSWTEPMAVEKMTDETTPGGADFLKRRGLQEVGGMPIGEAAAISRKAQAKRTAKYDEYGTPQWLRKAVDKLVPAGRVEYEANPLKALATYGKQSSNAIGRRVMESKVADAFGVPIQGTNANGFPIPANAEKNTKWNAGWRTMRRTDGSEVAVPADLANLVHGTFDQQIQTLSGFVNSTAFGKGNSKAAMAVRGVASLLDAGMTKMKRLALMPNVGYHVVNITDDTLRLWADGMENPAQWLQTAHRVLADDPSTVIRIGKWQGTAGELRDLAHRHNVATEGLAQAELMQTPGTQAERLLDKAQQAAGGPRKWAKTKAVGNAPVAAGEFVARKWRESSEMAAFIHRLSLGDSPTMAAKRVADVLLDYGSVPKSETGRWLHDVGTLTFPFFRYLFRSPKAAAMAAARYPARVQAGLQGPRALLGGDEEGPTVQNRVTERGGVARVGDAAKTVAGAAREAWMAPERMAGLIPEGAAAWRQGVEAVYQPRTMFSEAWNTPAALLRSLPLPWVEDPTSAQDILMSQTRPEVKTAFEAWAGRDALTGKPMPRPNATSMFYPNTPFTPPELQGTVGPDGTPQMAYVARILPQYFFNPMTQHIINRALFAYGGGWDPDMEKGAVPAQSIGQTRLFADPSRQAAQYGGQGIGMMSARVLEVSPTAAMENAGYSPAVGNFLDSLRGSERIAGQVQKARARAPRR